MGELPISVEDLLNSVRIKWIAVKIGFEKIIMKQNKLIGYFISDKQSEFYESKYFTKVLQHVQNQPNKCVMKEKQTRKGLRLLLTFNNITSVKNALNALTPILE